MSGAYAFALSGGKIHVQAFALAGFFLLFSFCVLIRPGMWRVRPRSLFVVGAIAFVLVASAVLNHDSYGSTAFVETLGRSFALVALMFTVPCIVWSFDAERILRIMAVSLLPLLVIAFAAEIPFTPGDRLSPLGVHPNWWGELLFALIASSLAYRRTMVRWSLILTGVGLLYLVQARGAMLAALVAVLVVMARESGPLFGRSAMAKLTLGLTLLSMVFVTGVMAVSTGSLGVLEFIRDDVLLVYDEYRGVGTGLTGRLETWSEAWFVFLERPFFGFGTDTMSAVHNGFLILASEGGVFLLVAVGWLVWGGLVAKWRSPNHVAVGIILGYLAMVMTYPRFLNLNVAATMFYVALFPWSNRYDCGATSGSAGRGKQKLVVTQQR